MTDLTTPTDDLPGTTPTGRRRVPNRGIRKRVLGDGDGDYCIYELVPPGSQLPRGTLIPIPNIPRFTTTAQAVKWIRQSSGDLLVGKQIMVFKAIEIMTIEVSTKPTIVIETKPKINVTVPKGAEVSRG